MNFVKFFSLMAFLFLIACSSTDHETASTYRGVANTMSFNENSEHGKKVKELTSKIFQAYLLGHVSLQKFDQQLDKDASNVLETETYDQLQAIRMLVEDFEHQIGDLYVDLVTITARPQYSEEQKAEAQASLAGIGSFMDGIRHNGDELPENLRPMILLNLVEKQTELYEKLDELRKKESDSKAKEVFKRNMVLLRATRMAYNKDLKTYQVNDELVKKSLQEEAGKKSFQDLQAEIKKLSGELRLVRRALKKDRRTSSDVFFPSAGSAGNVTGNGFPANTWSITYDDGPGGKTTPQVLSHLKNHQMKATFFVLAKQVLALPAVFKATADTGHDMASHSYTHAQLTKLGPQGLNREIDESKRVIDAKLGKSITLFRLPYGAGVSNANIRNKIAANNMIHVFWNVDTLDWQDKNPQKIFDRTIKQMSATKNRSGIVLFHDIHNQSVVASSMLMDYLQKNSLKVCTVQAVINQINKALPDCSN